MKREVRKRVRLSPDRRRRLIVEEALRFFAEHGFAANTRVLAQRIGVTQPLLFRYFATKDDLIEAVFALAYERLARRDWVSIITKPGQSLRTRLINFCYAYAASTYDFDWIRLYMFAGLAGGELNRRLIKKVTEPLLHAIAQNIRAELGVKTTPSRPISSREIEYLWVFHGGLYYNAVRRQVYRLPIDTRSLPGLVESTVDAMIEGYKRLLDKPPVKLQIGTRPPRMDARGRDKRS